MSPDRLNCSSKQSEWYWLITIETPQKVYSHIELMICCFKVQMFIICAQYLFLHLPYTQKQKKNCAKSDIHQKAGQMAVQPVYSCFLPAHSCSGSWIANLQLSLSNGWCAALDGPQLQPQQVATVPSDPRNQTKPHGTGSYQSGCGSSTSFDWSHHRLVRPSCYWS